MIISAEELMKIPEFSKLDEGQLQRKLESLEILVRKYTNNNFQNRNIRFTADSLDDRLFGVNPFIRVGDTIQVSESKVNDGLYVVTEVTKEFIRINKSLFTVEHNLVTKIEYPADVVQGVLDLMKWEVNNRDKVGIKSETLSRYSVTYFDLDANQVRGYPVSLLGFLESYKKARF